VETIIPGSESVILPPVSQAKQTGNVKLVAFEEPVASQPAQRRTLKAKVAGSPSEAGRRLSAVTAKKDTGIKNAKRVPRPQIKARPPVRQAAPATAPAPPQAKAATANQVRINWASVGADAHPAQNQNTTATIGRIITRASGDN